MCKLYTRKLILFPCLVPKGCCCFGLKGVLFFHFGNALVYSLVFDFLKLSTALYFAFTYITGGSASLEVKQESRVCFLFFNIQLCSSRFMSMT